MRILQQNFERFDSQAKPSTQLSGTGFLVWRLFLRWVLDTLLPERRTSALLRATTPEELRLAQTPRHADGIESLLSYRDPRITALIWELKYHRDPRAAQLAACLLADLFREFAADVVGVPLLIPVPMHPERRRQRGYNQTETLCEALPADVRALFAYAPDTLLRTRLTTPQQKLRRAERLRLIVGSMEIKNPTAVMGRVCVVLDDVTTTGATLREARRALLQAGAARVHCVALAS